MEIGSVAHIHSREHRGGGTQLYNFYKQTSLVGFILRDAAAAHYSSSSWSAVVVVGIVVAAAAACSGSTC